MSIIEQEMLPRGLIQSVSKLSFFKRQNRKLQFDVNSVSPNGVLRCRLPTSGLLSLVSLTWFARVNVAVSDASVPNLGCFIDSLRVSGDGSTIDEISSYNLLFQSLLNQTCSDPHARLRYAMGCLMPKPTFVIVDDVLSTSTDATAEGANIISAGSAAALSGVCVNRAIPPIITAGSFKNAVEVDWLGFLGSVEYILADQWPAITIELQMSGNNILSAGSGTSTWSIDNSYMTMDVINYAAALESYQALFERIPNQISPISYSFDRWVVQLQSAQASTVNTIQFNVASSNLRKILYSYRVNGFGTQAALGNGKEAPNYFVFAGVDGAANMSSSLLYVNGVQHNQYPISLVVTEGGSDENPIGYANFLTNLGVSSDNSFDNLVNSFNQYKTSKFCHAYTFDWVGTSASEISGINTQGGSNCELVIKSSAALTAGSQWVLMCQASGLIHVSPGRVLSIEY